jgi:hypothetical protein
MSENTKSISLLLVEFLTTDIYHQFRSEFFPYLSGFAMKLKIPVKWIRFGVEFHPDPSVRYIRDLNTAEKNFLIEEIKKKDVTHIIFNESVTASFRKTLLQNFQNLRIFCIGDIDSADFAESGKNAAISQKGMNLSYGFLNRISWITGWLGTGNGIKDGLIVDYVTPYYYYENANKLAEDINPFLKILCGTECHYRGNIAKNPFYKDLDLSDAARIHGCAFCNEQNQTEWIFSTDPLVLAFRQMDSLFDTSPLSKKKPEIMICGAVIFENLNKFLDEFIRKKYPSCSVMFTCRIDEFLKKAKIIEKYLPLFRNKKYQFHIWSMGVENFSYEENLRMNKGVANDQVLEAHKLVSRLEKEYSNNFFFTKHGSYSLILWTPWTTLDDLEINLEWAKKIRLDPEGLLLRSKLCLFEKRPITILAEHDGMILKRKRKTEKRYDIGNLPDWHMREVPWKFRNEEVQRAFSIMSRLPQLIPAPVSDPAYKKIQDFISSLHGDYRNPLIIAQTILKFLKKNPEEKSVEKILKNVKKELDKKALKKIEKKSQKEKHMKKKATPGTIYDREWSFKLSPTELLDKPEEIPLFLKKFLVTFLSIQEKHPEYLPGYEIESLRGAEGQNAEEMFVIGFSNENEDFLWLSVEKLHKDRDYFLRTQRFGINYHKETPPETPEKQRLVSIVGLILDKID